MTNPPVTVLYPQYYRIYPDEGICTTPSPKIGP
jgi:hypothetical protein